MIIVQLDELIVETMCGEVCAMRKMFLACFCDAFQDDFFSRRDCVWLGTLITIKTSDGCDVTEEMHHG